MANSTGTIVTTSWIETAPRQRFLTQRHRDTERKQVRSSVSPCLRIKDLRFRLFGKLLLTGSYEFRFIWRGGVLALSFPLLARLLRHGGQETDRHLRQVGFFLVS